MGLEGLLGPRWVWTQCTSSRDVEELSAQIAGAFNPTLTGQNLADGLSGAYVELGYDVLNHVAPGSRQSLSPFVRWETIDTQDSLPDGFNAVSGRDNDILTVGLNYKPIDSVVLKLDYQDWDGPGDRLQFLLGYVF